MKGSRLLKKPFVALGLIGYYLYSQTIGRLVYSNEIRESKYFSKIGSEGHKWLLKGNRYPYYRGGYFPASKRITIINGKNIFFHPEDLNNFQSYGIYFQAIDTIEIGKGSFIGPNVGLITSNHDLLDPAKRSESKPIKLGEKCWIGMNSIVLPGVSLGNHTVVGAGSVVTKSFPEGHCVIAGNPAKLIKDLKLSAKDKK